jgi:CheY-like chemotaxis protein
VEDNVINQEMMFRILQLAGFEVVIAADGLEAIDKAKSATPNLILMDLNLPRIDGWEATRRIKADPETSHIPIIAFTAHTLVGDREKSIAAGCDDYDTKPIDFDRLVGKITRLLGDR